MTNVSGQPLRDVLEAYFDVVDTRTTQDEVVIICPEIGCGDASGNRSFNLKNGTTSCWRCGNPTSGHAGKWLVSKGVDISEIKNQAVPTALIDKIEASLTTNTKTKTQTTVSLPRGCRPLAGNSQHKIYQLISSMAVRKHLEIQDLIDAGCQFTDAIFESTADWRKYCIFPVYEMGRLVYYQGRTYMDTPGASTKMFPSKHVLPQGSKYWVYNWDAASKPGVEVVIVVESILNVLSLKKALASLQATWAEPVAIFKHHLSDVQVQKLLLLDAPEICLMFDGDAVKAMWSEAKKLISSKQVSLANMPVGIDANDDVNLALERFEHRTKWSPLDALMASV